MQDQSPSLDNPTMPEVIEQFPPDPLIAAVSLAYSEIAHFFTLLGLPLHIIVSAGKDTANAFKVDYSEFKELMK